MLSGLALSAMLTALIAGIAGAWSPCGFSMVDTIGTALGDARRSATLLACLTFTVGAVAGGALTFGGLAAVGGLLGGSAGGVREALGAGLALAAAAADWRGVRIAPQIRRQVPESWRWTMPLPLACGLYGILLGLGFTTFVLAFAVWALAGISFAAGSPAIGLAIGVAFGLGRALPVLWMAPGMRGGAGEQLLDDLASEPRLWLGLRRLDALGLALCALFLSGTAAAAATTSEAGTPVAAGSDPSASGEALAWQPASGPGMLALSAGAQAGVLPGTLPALGPSSIAWVLAGDEIVVADRASLIVTARFAVPNAGAVALSEGWVVYRTEEANGSESLLGIPLSGSPTPRVVIRARAPGQIGRPSLYDSTVVFSNDTTRHSAIEEMNLATGVRRVLRSASSGAAFLNPVLLGEELLYERLDRCTQALLLGAAGTAVYDAILLTLPSTAQRDSGYQPGYEHRWNSASGCPGRAPGAGSAVRLGAAALGPETAFVTEVPRTVADATILAVPLSAPSTGASSRLAGRPRRAPAAPAARPGKPWQPDVSAAIAYAHTRAGEVSFAVRSPDREWGWRVLRTVPSASVLKAMLLVAYLDDPRVRNRPLTAADHRLIDPMIQHSDNAAATAVLGFVGPAGVYGVAQRAGMRNFHLDPVIWGLSRIDAADQARFFLHIDAHVVARHRAGAMHLLATVTPSQRWGIGRLRLPGWQLYFKGGWGAGTGEVEHQVALLVHGSVRISVAVLITSSPSHEYAKQTLQGLFERLLHGVGRVLAGARVARGR